MKEPDEQRTRRRPLYVIVIRSVGKAMVKCDPLGVCTLLTRFVLIAKFASSAMFSVEMRGFLCQTIEQDRGRRGFARKTFNA
jgi:hypothetical protein